MNQTMRFTIVAVCFAVGLIYNEGAADEDDRPFPTIKFGENDRFTFRRLDAVAITRFGYTYYGLDTETGLTIMVKTESAEQPSTIPNEAKIYEILRSHRGIPHFFYVGQLKDNTHVLATQIMRRTLHNVESLIRGKISVKTVCLLAIQMMYRIEYIHSKRLVHRDISPHSMGISNSGQLLYIFNFGMSEKYVDARGFHVRESAVIEGGSGSPWFMSAYAHTHTQSRRDDMESIGYVLWSLLVGRLPWQINRLRPEGLKTVMFSWRPTLSHPDMINMKKNANYEEVFQGYPKQFAAYFRYVRGLRFEERPDYQMLRRTFREALSGIGETDASKFDWAEQFQLNHIQK